MRKLIWLPIALVIGLLDGLLGATFSMSGLGFSLVIAAIVGLFVAGRYSVSIFFAVFSNLIKHLLSGVSIGWLELFSSLAITLAGVVRYFVGVGDKWIEWVSGTILLLALYFFELLVTRNFELESLSLLQTGSFGGVVLWIISNVAFVLLFSWLFRRLGKWIENEE